MKWPAEVWRRLIRKLVAYDGDGMDGLWLVSEDLKEMTRRLAWSRSHMQQAQRDNKQAMKHLEHTIDDLKADKKPFKIDTGPQNNDKDNQGDSS